MIKHGDRVRHRPTGEEGVVVEALFEGHVDGMTRVLMDGSSEWYRDWHFYGDHNLEVIKE